jgi:hypothetical protein
MLFVVTTSFLRPPLRSASNIELSVRTQADLR